MMVKKHDSIRLASSLAKQSNEQQTAKSATDFVRCSRAMIELQILALQSELQLLNGLSEMSDDEKLSTLFDVLDKDGDGKLSATELANGLQKVRGDENFEESLAVAVDHVATFDTEDQDGLLSKREFETLLDTLLSLIGCSFHELAEMLIMKVLFSGMGTTVANNVGQEVASDEVIKKGKVDEGLRYAMKDRRMKALFKVFDADQNGVVDFKQVVVGMYKLMDGIDEASHAAVTALLLFDEKQTRELFYKDFARLILSIVASLPEDVTFDDVAETLTDNASSASSGITDDYVLTKFSMDTTSKLLLDITDEDEFFDLGVVELAKLDRLFDMFNLAKTNRISYKELALGLRKFHDTTGMKTTVEEAGQVMNTFDKDKIGLNRQEFAKFIVNFARSANVKVLDMLDFMIVVTALKENTEAEQQYMKDIGVGRIDYWYG